MCPCVPKPSLMCPRLPVFVLSSTGLNQSTSSRLKNMNLTVQTRLLIWKACPDRTVLFTTTLLGSAESSEPVASNDCRLSGNSWNTRTEAGGKQIGAKVVMTICPSLNHLSYLCLLPCVCWEKVGQAANLLQPHWNTKRALDLTGPSLASALFLTTMLSTDMRCSCGRREVRMRLEVD